MENNIIENALYLFPVTIGDTEVGKVLPEYNKEILQHIRFFVVENIRTARRFLKKSIPTFDIDSTTFFELNEHTSVTDISQYLDPIADGHPMGVLSEAGCPAVADPGADIVAIAQRKGIKVVPLVGPSSIILSLMASGFNGQKFAFNGYLPVDSNERAKTLKHLEQRIYSEGQTQIFIETPYRNDKLLADIIRICSPNMRLCIAANITCDDERIVTKTLKQWKEVRSFSIGKTPCIFLLYK